MKRILIAGIGNIFLGDDGFGVEVIQRLAQRPQPEVEFQTGHALWALQAAGIPATHPQVAKAIDYLLARQQPFGGWMDPLQSYENFRTPFRETQMAILALSAYFPNAGRAKGWNAPRVERISEDPAEALRQLDEDEV